MRGVSGKKNFNIHPSHRPIPSIHQTTGEPVYLFSLFPPILAEFTRKLSSGERWSQCSMFISGKRRLYC